MADLVRQGDDEAFVAMVRRFEQPIRRQAAAFLGNPVAADDAAQETFVKAYLGRSGLRGARILPWLGRILHNHCIDLHRRAKTEQAAVDVLGRAAAVARGEQPGRPALLDLGTALTGHEREVLQLRIVENLSYVELAEITGLAEGSLRNLVSRALKKLREEVAAHGL